MRRIIIIIILALMTTQASAQLQISKSKAEKAETVETLYMQWNWLMRNGDVYYLAAKSANRFDDNYILMLGATYEDCISSLKSLEELLTTMSKTDAYDVNNGFGSTYSVTLYNELGTQGLSLRGDGFADTGYLYKVSIRKAIGWVRQNLKPSQEPEHQTGNADGAQ